MFITVELKSFIKVTSVFVVVAILAAAAITVFPRHTALRADSAMRAYTLVIDAGHGGVDGGGGGGDGREERE